MKCHACGKIVGRVAYTVDDRRWYCLHCARRRGGRTVTEILFDYYLGYGWSMRQLRTITATRERVKP